MTILVTGFEPFGGETENASGAAVQRLAKMNAPDGVQLATAILPVTWSGAAPALLRAVEEHRPDAIVAVGEAGGRAVVTPERWARNLGHGRIPDNNGVVRDAAPLARGPERLESRLDPFALTHAIRNAGVPAEVSDDAGAFLCNAIFWTALHGTDLPAAFLHVPAARSRGTAHIGAETDPEHAHADSALGLDDITQALAAAVHAAARRTHARPA
ncbi:pyroglutamyl-peptidase I [Kocuria rhizophila]|uniref:Pyroglutamyl-peptidase I n=1 Tax=Kocuria rhizophila (strain ATCC 9341 / DSM 348 / NBRC 103217 / DC2201) TaxID=378753 RepID=B2GJM0_KOCRD|nr:pyroglutamyl-peptidase I [Kocuria rhizophila]ASE10991.1 pyrrolidone-carboxylate peptidase [Kocuria rhizophila]BAG29049.1 putative pyrrolidone-carboxylate peptidase [Kocuria rhizophila DC2201]VEH75662.1 Pyrrolidone-carboxylate peptidase [Kocuria rhizophila]